jgi:hypothetical protein
VLTLFGQEKQRSQDLQHKLVEKDAAAAGKMAKLEADLRRIQTDNSSKDRDMAAKQAKMDTLEQLKSQAEEREKQARALVHELVGGEPTELEGPDEQVGWTQKLANGIGKFASLTMGLFRSDYPYQAKRILPKDSTFTTLAQLMEVSDPHNLGIGRDVPDGPWKNDYNSPDRKTRSLRLAAAWSLHNQELLQKYKTAALSVRKHMNVLSEFPSLNYNRHIETLVTALEGSLVKNLDKDINEQLLLHGTKPQVLHQILSRGLSEKFSDGIFGKGLYFAETVTKNDQYTAEDECYYKTPWLDLKHLRELHHELYGNASDHPEKVHYVIICRVIMGCYVRTKDSDEDMDRPGTDIWAAGTNYRELKQIPGAYSGSA